MLAFKQTCTPTIKMPVLRWMYVSLDSQRPNAAYQVSNSLRNGCGVRLHYEPSACVLLKPGGSMTADPWSFPAVLPTVLFQRFFWDWSHVVSDMFGASTSRKETGLQIKQQALDACARRL